MKNQIQSDKVRERPIFNLLSGVFKFRKEPALDLGVRSKPLTNGYNSTFIILVLSIAAILAAMLLVWP